jgi:hypothetical protein
MNTKVHPQYNYTTQMLVCNKDFCPPPLEKIVTAPLTEMGFEGILLAVLVKDAEQTEF